MTYEEQVADRHQALKQENNRAIKDAALLLSEERGLGNFTVEELAARAQVSRRTFFNHFGSIHEATRAGVRDILLDASESVMVRLSERLEAATSPEPSQLFELGAEAMLEVDFTQTIRKSCRVLGARPRENVVQAAWLGEVLKAALDDFDTLLGLRAPHVSQLERRLLVRLLLTTVEVCAEDWAATNLNDSPEDGLRSWNALLSAGINQLRRGYAA